MFKNINLGYHVGWTGMERDRTLVTRLFQKQANNDVDLNKEIQ